MPNSGSEIGADPGREQPRSAPQDGTPPASGPLDLVLYRVLNSMNALGSIWILVLMVVINIDVTGRTWFAAPLDGVIELIELSLVGIVFLQLGDATRHGRLTRSDGFFRMAQKRTPQFGRFLGAFFDALGVLFMVLILLGSVPTFFEAYTEDFYVGTVGIFTAPEWPVKLIVVIGCVFTALQFAAFGMRYLTGTHDRN